MSNTSNRILALLACVALPGVAGAAVSTTGMVSNSASSTEMLGAFAGSVSFTSDTATTGVLTISITNTTPISRGGYITGVIFNVPGTGGSASLTSATPSSFLNTGSESGSPFGTFEAGAAIGASFLGGGSPTSGIAIGATGTLVFAITAASTATLNAGDFLGTSAGKPNFLVRFRGMECDGSDKVPGVIPAPASAGLLALGGLITTRRSRTR